MVEFKSSRTGSPLISVIVPCYNQARFLCDAIRSLQAQTYSHWECLIINDGSTDDTAHVAAALAATDSRVRLINQANRERSAARNRGLIEAQGQFIQFLDADDLLENDKFTWQVRFLCENPGTGIVCSDVRYFPSESPLDRRFTLFDPDVPWLEPLWHNPAPLLEKFLCTNMMAINCPLVRRSVVERVGLLDERLSAMEDWHYWLRCAIAGVAFRFVPAPNTLALVRIHQASTTHDRMRMRRGGFELAVRAGRLLSDSRLRRKNFWLSVNQLPGCNWGLEEYHLLRAAWANRTVLVLFDCLRCLFVATAQRTWPTLKLLGLLRSLRNRVNSPALLGVSKNGTDTKAVQQSHGP
jgi:glycosyltransferase involved in cell wall biosynthesis